MRILRAEVQRVPMALREPYTIAYETIDRAENVFVQLVTDGAAVGLGVAAPDEGVTGETAAASAEALGVAGDALAGADPLRRLRALEDVGAPLAGCPAARAALDMALLDLLGKRAGLPAHLLLGGFRASILTSVTVFIDAHDRMLAEARRLLDLGFLSLKLKGGLDPDADAALVRAARRLAGPTISLRFDANQGYDAPAALRFLQGVAGADLEVFEQPTPRGHGAALRRVTMGSPVPVMADESLLDLRDALRIARGGLADLVNIKLMKVGGIDAALAVNAVALSAGLEVMMGCMDESALGIAAGLHVALARKNVRLADLDGHLDLLGDPGEGAVLVRGGHLHPIDAPGLGLPRLSCFG